jgi:hypothetical protein
MARKRGPTIDPQLKTQLARAAERDRSVEATFTLRPAPGVKPLTAKEVQAIVQYILDRATQKTQSKPTDVTVLPNVQSFVVCGPAGFIEGLLDEPEIDSATANYQREDLLIRPVAERGVPAKAVRRGVAPRKGAKHRRAR